MCNANVNKIADLARPIPDKGKGHYGSKAGLFCNDIISFQKEDKKNCKCACYVKQMLLELKGKEDRIILAGILANLSSTFMKQY